MGFLIKIITHPVTKALLREVVRQVLSAAGRKITTRLVAPRR
ncbi:MAG: hypothetical protein PHU25_22205 [Deltaproteobacteria bacterium]|nr:hypothetical protein [Deltaproteobacteria bacterium]